MNFEKLPAKFQLMGRRRKAPPQLEAPLPAIANKADDLEAIKKSVEDAASLGAPLWISYLFLLFYIAIAVGGVSHVDLLLENPVELPFLNIKLPLKAFFILAPILFVIVHAYVMAHFALLSDKAKRFHSQLKSQISDAHDSSHNIRDGLRQQLPINVFIQFLAGPSHIREGLFSLLLWAVAWISLVAGPVLVLLLLQLQFLPYHDTRVTWVQRGAFLFDVFVIIWPLWIKILSGRSKSDLSTPVSGWPLFWNGFLWWSRNIIAWPLTGALVLFSLLVATFPGEWEEWPFHSMPALKGWSVAGSDWIFGKVDPLNKNENERISGNWPVNTLRLKEFDLYEALKADDPGKLDLKPHTYILHDRHLEQADLRAARLGKIDLRKAHLKGAWLDKAWLPGASLEDANLQGALLVSANLQGASLERAQLQGAGMLKTQLQGALLDGATLRGAVLFQAQLQGASLNSVALEGSHLQEAALGGASLIDARLQGAVLNRAGLQGASLVGANLAGASLRAADLSGALLERARIEAADLSEVLIWRTKDLDVAELSLIRNLRSKSEYSEARQRSYAMLRQIVQTALPEGDRRVEALNRIGALDCDRNGAAPCGKSNRSRSLARLEGMNAKQDAYEKALLDNLRSIICSGEDDAIFVLRGISADGLLISSRLSSAGREATVLIDEIIRGENSENCPVFADVTDADKAKLLRIRNEVENSTSAAAPYSNADSGRFAKAVR